MKPRAIHLLLVACLAFSAGCSDLAPPDPPEAPAYWSPLWIARGDFVALLHDQGSLYAVDRKQGVFVQHPAFAGAWVRLGPELQNVDDPFGYNGVRAVAHSGDLLVAGLSLPATDGRPCLYQRKSGDTKWTPSSFDARTPVLDLIADGTGTVFGLDRAGVFLTRDGGETWIRVLDPDFALKQGTLARGADGIYCAGQASTGQPRLFRSQDEGATWAQIPVAVALGVLQGSVLSVATSGAGAPPELFTNVNGEIYRSGDGGTSFQAILEVLRVPGTIYVNPQDSREVLIASEQVFWTRDAGTTWDVFMLPQGIHAGLAAVDWEHRRVAVQLGDVEREALYEFNLDLASVATAPAP